MKRNGLCMGLPAAALAFGFVVMLSGCASTKNVINTPNPRSADTAWLNISLSLKVEQFDGKRVKWDSSNVIAITPGEHTLRIRGESRSASRPFTFPPGSYSYITVADNEITLVDVTDQVLHGSGSTYNVFSEAEKKAGVTRLSNGIGRIRAPDRKNVDNYGVYDISVDPASLVTLEITAKDGQLYVVEFDGERVFWVGDKDGSVIRIPAGQHSLSMDYSAERSGGGSPHFSDPVTGVLNLGFAIGSVIKNKLADKRDTSGINLNYEFHPGATYQLAFMKNPEKGGPYALAEIIPGKGAPRGQQRGRGSLFADTAVPAAAAAPVQASGAYNVAVNGNPTGPYAIDELRRMAQGGELTKDTMVWKEGMQQWAAAGTIEDLSGIWSSVPPPLPPR
jgi:hypothetical protein